MGSGGDDWTEQLLVWLDAAYAVIVIVSQHSAISPSVKNEVLLALDDQRRVIPVVREKTRGGLWVLIRSLQWIDARDGRDPVPDLVRALNGGPRNAQPPVIDQTLSVDDVMRRLAPPPAHTDKAQITIVLPGDVQKFDNREQMGLIQLIARFTRLRSDQIKIVRVEAGSVHVTLELPEDSARRLVTMYEQQTPLIELLDIQAVYDLRVLPTPGSVVAPPGDAPPTGMRRLTAWPRGWTRLRSLSLAGALVAALLIVALSTTLRGPALPTGAPVGVVTSVQGTLEMQESGWNAFVPMSAGARLRAGDRLRLAPGAQADVVCADGTQVALQTGTTTVPCQSSTNPLLFDIDQTPLANAVLSGDDTAVPQVITPRATALLTTTPTIRWTPVEGVVTYAVTLRREGEEVWSVAAPNTTTLTYPADQPPLDVGPIYRFVVTADGGAEEFAQGAGVQVFDDQQAQTIRVAAQQIAQRATDDATQRVLLANLYARNGLYAEALTLLESPVSPSNREALRLLGDVYLAVGLPDLAVAPYTQARDTAEKSGDRLGEAQANRMLGMVYSRLGGAENRALAQASYQQALQFYQEVGDVDAQTELQQRLADLS